MNATDLEEWIAQTVQIIETSLAALGSETSEDFEISLAMAAAEADGIEDIPAVMAIVRARIREGGNVISLPDIRAARVLHRRSLRMRDEVTRDLEDTYARS